MRTSKRNKSTLTIPQVGTTRTNSSYSNPSVNSYEYYSRQSQSSHYKKKKKSVGKIVAITLTCVLLVAVLGIGTALALFANSVNNSFVQDKSEEELLAIDDALAPATTFSEPFYMLLIGSDARVNDASMGARSDTNVLVRVDAQNATVTLISIPRDTRIEIDGYGMQKFNAAYSYGGAASTIREASQLCGVEISHYAEVDFDSLTELVDAIGGVEVDVPVRIEDKDAGDGVIEAGTQTLDGYHALMFARSRKYVDGDFTRTSNQRLLIESIMNKMVNLSIAELPSAIQAGAACVSTDLKVNDLFDLAMQFKNAGELTVYSAMVPSTTQTIDGISYVIEDTEAMSRMMKLVEAGEDPSTLETGSAIGSAVVSQSSKESSSSE